MGKNKKLRGRKGKKPKGNDKNMDTKKKKETILTGGQRSHLQMLIREFECNSQPKLILKGLSSDERKYLHSYVVNFGMQSRSFGVESNREIHIWRKSKQNSRKTLLILLPKTRDAMAFPMFSIESRWLVKKDHENSKGRFLKRCGQYKTKEISLNFGPLQTSLVPPRKTPRQQEQNDLPVSAYREKILEMLKQSKILVISGETSSGKTTQIPQFILDDATVNRNPCRIFVIQPRRIGAITLAQRVAEERGEKVGTTVGYKIHMENVIKYDTNLIYITSGSFLRLIMMNSEQLAQRTTHVIFDEIHERDAKTDFGMIIIKDLLSRHEHLKLILMSATMDVKALSKYFYNCPIIKIPGRSYKVDIYHLEDILYYSGYRNKEIESTEPTQSGRDSTFTVKESEKENTINNLTPVQLEDTALQASVDELIERCMYMKVADSDEAEATRRDEINEIFDQLLYYIESEGVPVNIGHSTSNITPLMAACKLNLPDYIRILIEKHKANANCVNKCKLTALDYAREHDDLVQIVENSIQNGCQSNDTANEDLVAKKMALLESYQKELVDPDSIDHDLILFLLKGLCSRKHYGAIMVFLPGYSDIMQQKRLIENALAPGTYHICILYGLVATKQADIVFASSAQVRKIILSTNIGQTSITVKDLVYIIDCGRVKNSTFDSFTESTNLRLAWISKADASQRTGRAGRLQNGICYRLYSTKQYSAMPKFNIPEFLSMPLTELCLYAKVLDGNSKIQDFLLKALSPPAAVRVDNAVKRLKLLGALCEDESVTDLGRLLAEIPINVQLGICLLHGLFYRCIDPILTICAYHSVKDPFVLSVSSFNNSSMEAISTTRKRLCGDILSDQKGILTLYENYLYVRNHSGDLRDFCALHSISFPLMSMIHDTREQLHSMLKDRFHLTSMHRVYNNHWRMVQLCLVAGLYPNVAFIDRLSSSLLSGNVISKNNAHLVIKKNSILYPPGNMTLPKFVHSLPHEWIIFYEKVRLTSIYSIGGNTIVPSLLIAIQCGMDCSLSYNNAKTDETQEAAPAEQNGDKSEVLEEAETCPTLSIDNCIKFDFQNIADAEILMRLRTVIQDAFQKFLLMITGGISDNFDYFEIADYVNSILLTLPTDNDIREEQQQQQQQQQQPQQQHQQQRKIP